MTLIARYLPAFPFVERHRLREPPYRHRDQESRHTEDCPFDANWAKAEGSKQTHLTSRAKEHH
jgi:hypothetical protein